MKDQLLELFTEFCIEHEAHEYNDGRQVVYIKPMGVDVERQYRPFFEFSDAGELQAVGAYEDEVQGMRDAEDDKDDDD